MGNDFLTFSSYGIVRESVAVVKWDMRWDEAYEIIIIFGIYIILIKSK